MKAISKSSMNKLVKYISKNQNKKKPLNAGQIREAISLTLKGLYTQLTSEAGNELINDVNKVK